MISFRLVEPSSRNASEPCCEAREDTRKSSMEPKCFLMLASVWLRVSPFKEVVSPVTSSYTSKFKSVLASIVSSPLMRLVYFVDSR